MGWDSNPRDACTPGGFQDRCLKPLGHPSGPQPRYAAPQPQARWPGFRGANTSVKPATLEDRTRMNHVPCTHHNLGRRPHRIGRASRPAPSRRRTRTASSPSRWRTTPSPPCGAPRTRTTRRACGSATRPGPMACRSSSRAAGRAVWGDGVQRISIDLSQSIFTPRNTQLSPPEPARSALCRLSHAQRRVDPRHRQPAQHARHQPRRDRALGAGPPGAERLPRHHRRYREPRLALPVADEPAFEAWRRRPSGCR